MQNGRRTARTKRDAGIETLRVATNKAELALAQAETGGAATSSRGDTGSASDPAAGPPTALTTQMRIHEGGLV